MTEMDRWAGFLLERHTTEVRKQVRDATPKPTDPHDPHGSPTLPPTINEVFPVDLPGELRVNGRKIARQAAGLKDKLQTVAISEYLNQKASLDKNTRIHFHKVEQVNLEGN